MSDTERTEWDFEEVGFSCEPDATQFAVNRGGVDGKVIAICALQGDAMMVCDALNLLDQKGCA